GLPDGRAVVAAYVRDMPHADSNLAANLIKHFPALGGSEQSLEKWWALSMARFAASDRYHGLSLEESEKQLAALLTLEIPAQGENKKFSLGEFRQFVKIPAGHEALKQKTAELIALSAQAHAL